MRTVTIAAGPPPPRHFGGADTVIVVDVIRSMTTAVTALAAGLRVFPVPSLEAAHRRARRLGRALLAGELGGTRPAGFDLDNSPAAIARLGERARFGRARPIVLLSSSGTRLLDAVAGAGLVLGACLRNAAASAAFAAERARQVYVLGAATRGEFREEDQLCCARIAAALAAAGFALGDDATAAMIARWSSAPPTAFLGSRSVAYLRATNQLADLAFILEHSDDDLDTAALLSAGELVCAADALSSCG